MPCPRLHPPPPVPRPPGHVGRGDAGGRGPPRPGPRHRTRARILHLHGHRCVLCGRQATEVHHAIAGLEGRRLARQPLLCVAITQAQSAAARRLGGAADQLDQLEQLRPARPPLRGCSPGRCHPARPGPGRARLRPVTAGRAVTQRGLAHGDRGGVGPRRGARGQERTLPPRIRPQVSGRRAARFNGTCGQPPVPLLRDGAAPVPGLRVGDRRQAGPGTAAPVLHRRVPVEGRAPAGAGRRVADQRGAGRVAGRPGPVRVIAPTVVPGGRTEFVTGSRSHPVTGAAPALVALGDRSPQVTGDLDRVSSPAVIPGG